MTPKKLEINLTKNRHMSKKMDIVNCYLREYSADFSGREIARKLDLSAQAALNALNELVLEKVLIKKVQGRNYLYSLNLRWLYCKLYLQLAELSKSAEFCRKFELKTVINSLLPFAETIIVFGSYAKGLEKKGSDIDLIVINGNKEDIGKAKGIFPFEVNIEFVTWKLFTKTLKERKALALEIKKNHLIYGNVFKVIDIYCEDR